MKPVILTFPSFPSPLPPQADVASGRGNLNPGETDPNTKFWRCPLCNAFQPVLMDHADCMRPEELPYWRYKIARYRLHTFLTDWLTHLFIAENEGWCASLLEHFNDPRADPKHVIKGRTLCVRAREAEEFMIQVPIYVAGLLDWGFKSDNPTKSAEADVLTRAWKYRKGRSTRRN